MTKLTLDNDKQVFFYEQDFYVLSNFSSFSINHFSFDFPTAEHLYHYLKFDYNTNNDNDLRSKCAKIKNGIATAKSAHEAFHIAQDHKEFRDPEWDKIKFDKMLQILRLKVEQHEYVKKKLLETGDRELIENSWRDDVWGWGENRDGQNALGKLWMIVREEVRLIDELQNPPLPSVEDKVKYLNLTESSSEFLNLISNLQVGDEIWKRHIDVESDKVIKAYKILEVQHISQSLVEVNGFSSMILFSEFPEKQQNSALMGHSVGNSPENIYLFIKSFSEQNTSIGVIRRN